MQPSNSECMLKKRLNTKFYNISCSLLLHLMCANACAHASTRATSLMLVKIARATSVYDIYFLGH